MSRKSDTNLVDPEVECVGGELEERHDELTAERDSHDELLASSLPDYSVTQQLLLHHLRPAEKPASSIQTQTTVTARIILKVRGVKSGIYEP